MTILEEIKKEYCFEVIDLLNLFENSEELFIDCVHLNYRGAETFTSFLKDNMGM